MAGFGGTYHHFLWQFPLKENEWDGKDHVKERLATIPLSCFVLVVPLWLTQCPHGAVHSSSHYRVAVLAHASRGLMGQP